MILLIRLRTLALLGCALIAGLAESAEPKGSLRGAEFRVAWNSEVSARFDQRSLREVLESLCKARRIARIIDRRLDPDQSVSSALPPTPLSELLSQLVESIQADAVVVGSTVIVGPLDSIRELRTLAEAQRMELQQRKLTSQRKLTLGHALELHWEDLAEPRQLVEQIAQRGKIDLVGAELIPYDLWGSGDLVGVTAGEALTILAWQYDLQLKWLEDGRATLVPLGEPVRVTRPFVIPEKKRAAAKDQFPHLVWMGEGKSLQVTGRVEELEAVDQWLNGGTKPKLKPKKGRDDWRFRTFTLRIMNAPLKDVLVTLQQEGIPLVWDEEALVAAGVDLKAKIQLELKDADADELLSALCGPGKLKYEITETGAKISAR